MQRSPHMHHQDQYKKNIQGIREVQHEEILEAWSSKSKLNHVDARVLQMHATNYIARIITKELLLNFMNIHKKNIEFD